MNLSIPLAAPLMHIVRRLQRGRKLRRRKTEKEALGDIFLRAFAEGLVETGVIDPRGKNDKELQNEVIRYLKTNLKNPDVILSWTIDHTPVLLREARTFTRNNQPEIACLFYAIWFEHWLNDLISIAGRRKRLAEEEVIQIIRETQFRGKSTWLLRVLGFKPINKAHLKLMQSIIDARNAFVHYKWKRTSMDDDIPEKEKQALIELLNNAERTVNYLRRLKNQQVYYGRKKKILPR